MENKEMMRDDVVYNSPDNEVMVKTNGDLIYIICNNSTYNINC